MAVRNTIKIIVCSAVIVGFALNPLLTSAQTPDDEVAAAMKEFNAGVALTKVHDKASLTAAIQKFQTAQVVFEKYKVYDAIASTYLTIGMCQSRLGLNAEALANLEKSLANYEIAKDDEGITLALNSLGEYHIKPSGDPAKARDYLLRAWELVQKHPDNTLDLTVLDNLGYSYVLLADYKNATDYLWKEVELAMKRGDEEYVNATQSYGDALVKLEVPGWAPTYYELALRRARQANLKTLEAQILNAFGELYLYNLNERQKAFVYFTDALKVSETVDELHTRTLILNNLAQCHYQNFEFQKALEYYDRAMATAIKESNLQSQATIMMNTGNVYQSLNDYKKANSIYEEARRLAQQIGDRSVHAHAIYGMSIVSELEGDLLKAISQSNEAINLVKDLPGVRQFLIDVLLSRGNLYLKSGLRDKALEIYTNSLETAKERNYRSSQGKLLNNIGKIHELNGDLKGALKYYNEALIMARALGEKYTEARVLENMMVVWSKLGNQALAAFFGKSSVNVYQELRKNISNLSPEHQRSFIGTFEETYRKLSEILILLGRIAEAEQVLTMLKEEELLGFVRRDDSVAKQMLATMSISEDERAAITRYDAIAGQITSLGRQFDELEIERKTFPSKEFPKQAQYDKLKQDLADASTVFEKFLEDLKLKFGQKDTRVVQVDSGLKKTLDRLKATRTAAVSTIVGEDTLNIIVTTSKTQRAHTVKVSANEIKDLVAKFHIALKSPQYDPRPLGQKLYDLIVKPIESDLAGIKADTILWSLDGSLRYIPPAAFWDKQNGYMVERFANVMVNLANRTSLEKDPLKFDKLSILGVGVSKPTEGFSALTAVPDELDCIVSDETVGILSTKPQCANGVLAGRKLLDEQFTLANFEGELGRYPVLHIASHFKLIPGDDKNSFLLLGGGSDRKFTVEKLRNEPLGDLELMVLSACNTATPAGVRANGIEVESFSALAQEEARSVIATLWSVADTSTKDFMVEFYRLYGKEGLSKGDAMRRAQLKLMYGKYSADEAQKNRADDFVQAVDKTLPPYKPDPNAPFAHPFYWSPFTLIGNWR